LPRSEPAWNVGDSKAGSSGPLTTVLGRRAGGALGAVASRLYRFEIGRRNRAFDAGRGVTQLDIPVISVGNLSVGGTGKTPFVEWVVRRLVESGRCPCIAMRGYAPGGGESDEAAQYQMSLDVPVVAQADRTSGVRGLLASEAGRDVDCVVLDDGFQHRRLARDLDIVLLDATRSPFEDRLLPAGWLREPVESLKRASLVVITRCDQGDVDSIDSGLMRVLGRAADGACRHGWRELSVRRSEREGGGDVAESVEMLTGLAVCLVCAIGNPGAFRRQALSHGARVVHEVVLADHDPYEEATVERIHRASEEADAILTTAKDWTKLRRHQLPVRVIRPRVEIDFQRGGDALAKRVLTTVTPTTG